jgi:predicted kinase
VLFLGYGLSDPDLRHLLTIASNGRPDRMSQMVGVFTAGEIKQPWRRMVLDDRVRENAPLVELSYEQFGDSPSAGLTNLLRDLRQLVSPESLPRLSKQTIVFTNGYTATLKTELCEYLANCLGVPLLATHRYGGCTTAGLLDPSLRQGRYAELLLDAESILSRGHSVILDGTFADPNWREKAYDLARRIGASVVVIKTRCEDENYIKARLWRRRLDHSRSEHEVVDFRNYRITYADVMKHPVEEDPGFDSEAYAVVNFNNEGDRTVEIPNDAATDAKMIADLIRISPLMSIGI